MRVAFFHNLSAGGAKRVVFEQVKYLSKKHEVEVFEIDQKENNYLNLAELVPVKKFAFSLSNKYSLIFKRLVSDYNNFYELNVLHKKIAKDIDNGKFDVVIVHPDIFTQAPFLLRYLKTSNIYYAHESLRIVYEPQFDFNENVILIKKLYEKLTRKIRKNIDRKNISKADRIICNSRFTKENIKKAYGLDCSVCYPGINTNLFKNLKIKKTTDVLFIGEMEDSEGYPLLKNLMEDNLVKLKILSRKNRKFTLTDKELVNEYNKTKIVLCLNRNEPLGLIPLEAMSCGVPVIAVDEGGFKETVKHGLTGYLVKRDGKDIFGKIKNLLGEEKLYNRMSKNCRDDILKNWAWEKRIGDLEKFLKT
jgi:glycosyltransferase involved in cell wall biosynthesis